MSRACVLALVCLAWLSSGCFTLRAQVPGALRGDLDDEEVVVTGTFDAEVTRLYLLWGLVPLGPDDELAVAMTEAVEQERADGVANLVFEARFTVLDYLLQALTLGVVAPRTYRVRGDVVRIEASPLPGRPLLRPRRERGRHRPTSPPLDPGGSSS